MDTNIKKYDSIELARHIAYLCLQNEYDYNNTKIQKLLYICYGVILALKDKILINESPCAWPYGPVFPRVFNYIKNDLAGDYAKPMNIADIEIANIIEHTIKCFGKFFAGRLSGWSHKEGSPWDTIIKKNHLEWNTIIPDNLIKQYFEEKVIKHNEEPE